MICERRNRSYHDRLLELIDDVADQCPLVMGNGPEPHYADEKLNFAFRRLTAAPVLVGWTPTELRDEAARTTDEEVDRW